MILATNNQEDEPVSFLTLNWIEQNINKCANQLEVRDKLKSIKFEYEAQQLIQEMEANRLIPGFHYTAHKLVEQKEYRDFLEAKENDSNTRTT